MPSNLQKKINFLVARIRKTSEKNSNTILREINLRSKYNSTDIFIMVVILPDSTSDEGLRNNNRIEKHKYHNSVYESWFIIYNLKMLG